jgi:hypothetical protein
MRAINRNGDVFEKGEIVMMVDQPTLYETMKNQELEIIEIKEWDDCESGFMIQVVHKESGTPFKRMMDTNWFQKLNNGENKNDTSI